MRRIFNEHDIREIASVSGFWDFVKDEKSEGSNAKWFKVFPKQHELMSVPSCWDSKPEYFDYDGVGWYRTWVFVGKKCHALLRFEGVSGIAEVFWDGTKIAEHNGSYTAFDAINRDVEPGTHELIIKVDNHRYPGKVMPDYADWFLYGGIFRPVELSLLQNVWIKNLRIHCSIKNRKTQINPVVVIENLSATSIEDVMTFWLNGMKVAEQRIHIKAHETKTIACSIGQFALASWSPDSPAMHSLRVEFVGDDLRDRFGVRIIENRNGKILLNGNPTKILGVNRHHDYGDCGFTVPPELTLRDFQIIRDMGCNAVRCHYPMDKYALDICDELGLLVWSEIPFYGRWDRVVAQEPYLKLADQFLQEMINSDFNHPSIFAWSILNECATDTPDGVKVIEQLTKKARSLDESRAITYASNKGVNDKGFSFLDMVGINSYPGWYDAKPKIPEWCELIPQLKTKIRRECRQSIPILVTETGAAGLYGDRGLEPRKWTEEQQAEIIERSLAFLLSSKDVAGVFIWQFCDARTQTTMWHNRPGCYNNKGLLDRFRRPKLAYYSVKKLYRACAEKNTPINNKKAKP